MKRIPKLLSKTKLMRGFRCQKALYLTIHHPELEPPVTPELQALFDQGNEVGQIARQYIPGGTLVDCKPWEFGDALSKTRELIAAGTTTIYEAAFEYMGCYARADIIQYSQDTKRWSIFEVKSTTSVKPEHLQDAGLQTWIMAKSGLPIEKIYIMHLNRDCRYPDLSNLFVTVEVTQEMRDGYLSIQPKIKEMITALNKPSAPVIDIGPYCLEPTECPFVKHCWQHIPPMSIFQLPGMKERKWELYQQGIIKLDDERLSDLTDIQQRIVDVHQSGIRFMDKALVNEQIRDWQYPFIFLDFETINPAIPRFPGCGPYMQVPFQFSVHRLAQRDAEFEHVEFLHVSADDPRPALSKALLQACGTEGAIIAYYGRFEADRIRELATFDEENRDALLALIDRIVDPLPVFRAAIYDAAFAGSFSLKYVAPAILGNSQSYTGMMVANGGDAQRAYAELIAPNTPPERRMALDKALRDYCHKDTRVMADLVMWLFAL